MAKTAGPIADILMERIRAEGGIALGKDFVMTVLNICQKIINYSLGLKILTENQTITTSLISVMSIDNRPLKFAQNDVAFLEAESLHEIYNGFVSPTVSNGVWCELGWDYIFAVLSGTSNTYRCTYVDDTTNFSVYTTHYNTALEIPDEAVDLMLGLAEIILLVQAHLYATAKVKASVFIKQFTERRKVCPNGL
jgi:hypothetical protein